MIDNVRVILCLLDPPIKSRSITQTKYFWVALHITINYLPNYRMTFKLLERQLLHYRIHRISLQTLLNFNTKLFNLHYKDPTSLSVPF